jgi:hypothetical protein
MAKDNMIVGEMKEEMCATQLEVARVKAVTSKQLLYSYSSTNDICIIWVQSFGIVYDILISMNLCQDDVMCKMYTILHELHGTVSVVSAS